MDVEGAYSELFLKLASTRSAWASLRNLTTRISSMYCWPKRKIGSRHHKGKGLTILRRWWLLRGSVWIPRGTTPFIISFQRRRERDMGLSIHICQQSDLENATCLHVLVQ
jgi:hypothetical protein